MRYKDRVFLYHLSDIIYTCLTKGVDSKTEVTFSQIELLSDYMESLLTGLAPDDADKVKRKAIRKTISAMQDFYIPDVNDPKNPSKKAYTPDKIILTVYHFIEIMIANGVMQLAHDNPIALTLNYALDLINTQYNDALDTGDKDMIYRTEVRIKKAQKLANKWYENFLQDM